MFRRSAACALAFAASFGSAISSRGLGAQTLSKSTEHLQMHQFTSRVFGNERMLRVLVPPDYTDPRNASRRYPVLYLNDGQNLFDGATGTLNNAEWRVDETVRDLVSRGEIEPIIVVGIDNAGRRERPREYLPFPDEYLRPPEPSPRGSEYPRFLLEEVKPFIDSLYRTRADRHHTALGGSSYGALAALYAYIQRPDAIGRLLIESPSLYVHDDSILTLAAGTDRWPDRIFLGVGTNEENQPSCVPADTGGQAVRDVRRLAKLLSDKMVGSIRLRTTIVPCATHHEDAWAARLPDALRFLFPYRTADDADAERQSSQPGSATTPRSSDVTTFFPGDPSPP